MIVDAQGRRWNMRFKRYQLGWQWTASHNGYGRTSGETLFATKALAEADAKHSIQSFGSIAAGKEHLTAEFEPCGGKKASS